MFLELENEMPKQQESNLSFDLDNEMNLFIKDWKISVKIKSMLKIATKIGDVIQNF